MKILPTISLSIIMVTRAMSQDAPIHCNLVSAEAAQFKKNNVLEQWEYKMDKKTKRKVFNSVSEFDTNGCMVKHIIPASTGGDHTYHFSQWKFDEQGKLLTYSEGEIGNDSAKTYSFSESYIYNPAGLVSNYQKEIYEGLMSQTVERWNFFYSGNGEKTELGFSRLIARKDTISNDEIRYAGNGTPIERTLNTYSPKGFSEYHKYNDKGLPDESIRYEKEKMVSHKFYTYDYDKQGLLQLITITDGVAKTSETKKYDLSKITYTLMNTKGKILKTTTEPYSPPVTIAYPPIPSSKKPSEQTAQTSDKMTAKEKTDKKKNRIVEHYDSQKLVSTDTFNPKGLLVEKSPQESGFVLKYEYTVY